MATFGRSLRRCPVDPLQPLTRQGWGSVELVMIAMVVCAFYLIPWMMAAYSPSSTGESRIAPGMSQKEVLVILGQPNEHDRSDVCWNYDRFHDGKDRFCVQFDDLGRVKDVSPKASH